MAEQMSSEEQTMNASSVLVLDQTPENHSPQPPAPTNETTNQTRTKRQEAEKRVKKSITQAASYHHTWQLWHAALVMYWGPLVVSSSELQYFLHVYNDL